MMPESNGEEKVANILYDEGFDHSHSCHPVWGCWWTFTGQEARWNGAAVGEAYRKAGGTTPPTIQQPIRDVPGVGPVGVAQRVQVTFDLQNTSGTRQRVNVLIQDDNPSDPRLVLCTFWLAPNAPKRQYAMTTHTALGWPNGRFIVAPQTAQVEGSPTQGWIQLDNVTFRKTGRAMLGTECYEPGSFLLDGSGFIMPDVPQAPAPAPMPLPEADAGSGVPGFRSAGVPHQVPKFRGAGVPRYQERAGAGQRFSVEAGSLDPAAPRGPWSWVHGPGSEERALAGPQFSTTPRRPGSLVLGPGSEERAGAGPPSSDSWLDGLTFHSDSSADVSGPAIAPEPVRTDPLTVIIGGTSSGTVTSNPGGITCAGATVSCTGWFPEGAPVTLTATPDAGMVFVGWAGACTGTGSCQVTVNGPKSVVAHFASPLQYCHLDMLGSVRMITDAAGAARERRGAAGPHKRARLAGCRGPRQPRNDPAPRLLCVWRGHRRADRRSAEVHGEGTRRGNRAPLLRGAVLPERLGAVHERGSGDGSGRGRL